MSDLQTEMNRVVQGFVAQITELARRADVDALQAALGGKMRGRGGAVSVGRPRGRGAKRTADELDQLAEAFVSFVRTNPGLRIEQINKQLGSSTKDLALPIRKLIADGTINTKGKKRSTTYFPGKRGKKN